MITLGPLNAIDGVRHGFFTRQRGYSTGLYASNNCGYGSNDDPKAVSANRASCMERLSLHPDALVTVHQVHGTVVERVTGPRPRAAAPEADAMVTAIPGVALGVLAADCVPILFADAAGRVIGAAHAGWRGALAGVAEATIEAMIELGAPRKAIVAVLGPSIQQRSYEVGPEFPAPFLAHDRTDADLFAPARRSGHLHFDLSGYLARRLKRAGIGHVEIAPHDTFVEADRFFSYRRATKLGEPDYGRNLSVIVLAP